MASTQSPHTASESSIFSPGYTANPSQKRKRGLSGTQSRSTIREYGFMRDTGGHDHARFVGSSSGIHFIRNVHLRLARRFATRTRDRRGPDGTVSELVPGEDDQLRRERSQFNNHKEYLWKDHEVGPQDVSSISFDQLTEWSKSYFESWHPILPFLNGPHVLRIFEDITQHGVASLDHLDMVILRSVMSISLADSRQRAPFDEPLPASLIFGTVEEAMSSSQFALEQPASIHATQATLSVQLFLISMLRLNAASRLGGLIVRMAFHLGLHRCPTRYPFFTVEEAATRRRLFWCLYCSERLICQYLGIPFDIRDDDIDVCYPGEEHHSSETSTNSIEADRRLRLLALTAKHAKIRGLIADLRNKAIESRRDTTDREVFVQIELAKWSNEIQDIVEDEGDPTDDHAEGRTALNSSHRLVLLLSKYESTISLNRPMMASDPSSPAWSAAMQACISAAKSISIALKCHLARNAFSDRGRSPKLVNPMLWPSFTWAAWISAFVLAYGAIEQQMPLDVALRHIQSIENALRHIAERDTLWPEHCLSTIDELKYAVRELSNTHKDSSHTDDPQERTASAPTSSANRHGVNTRSSTNTQLPNPSRSNINDNRRHSFSRVVATQSGLDDSATPHEFYSNEGPSPLRPPKNNEAVMASHHIQGDSYAQDATEEPATASHAGDNLRWRIPRDNHPNATPPNPNSRTPTGVMPGEGQEALMWYDQLFASTFSAIENPFLAAAPFDSSIDPNWSYLR